MDGIKDEPPASEDKEDGRGAWNTVQLGILYVFTYIKIYINIYIYIFFF